MNKEELTTLRSRAVASLLAEAATEWRLLAYGELSEAVLERTGVELKGTFDVWARLGDVSGYMLEQDLPMVSAIVVNENEGLVPGKKFVRWVVEERTGRDPDKVSKYKKRRLIADEQLATFQQADDIMEAVRRWTLA